MNMKRVVALSVVMCLAGLTACSKMDSSAPGNKATMGSAPETKATTTKVQIDLGTPDKALKSYWAVRDSIRGKQIELSNQINIEPYITAAEQLNSVTEGSLFKSLSPHIRNQTSEAFARDIIDVKVESESRAVVIAVIKNTTPIPVGAEVSKHEEESRRDGGRYKYVLEKIQAGWRVSEIWDWGYVYGKSPLLKDWNKRFPNEDNDKPVVPSSTYNGH